MRKLIIFIMMSVLFTGKAACPYEIPADIECIPPTIVCKAPIQQPAYSNQQISRPEPTQDEETETTIEEELTEDDKLNITALAKMAAGEYFLIDTPEHQMQCAAVVECAMWRVMAGEAKGFRSTPLEVVTQPYQFHGYNASNYVSDELWLFVAVVYSRAVQVINGADALECGCVLPPSYLWFYGTGTINVFRDQYGGGNTWDWSWGNPYQNG